MNYEEAISFDNLYTSMTKCKKNVMWKDNASHFVMNSLESVYKLNEELTSDTYKPRNPCSFTITSPKVRNIISVCFRDRVYQRSLNDNILYPTMTKSFIKGNCACQIGKGDDFARDMLKRYLIDIWHKNKTNNLYALCIDIKGYYPNMPHDKTEKMFEDKLDKDTFINVKRTLNHQYEGDKGYNPGSQLIQIAGISYLSDKVDHYIKEQLHIKYYVRYMDDLRLIHSSREYLETCLVKLIEELKELGFEVSKKKTKILNLSQNDIPFLGFLFRMTSTGKILMLANPDKIKEQKRHIRHLINRYKDGYIDKSTVDMSFTTMLSYLEKGDTYNIRCRLIDYYNKLMGENNGYSY